MIKGNHQIPEQGMRNESSTKERKLISIEIRVFGKWKRIKLCKVRYEMHHEGSLGQPVRNT